MPIVTAVSSWPIPNGMSVDPMPASIPVDSPSPMVISVVVDYNGMPIPNRRISAVNTVPAAGTLSGDDNSADPLHQFSLDPLVVGTYLDAIVITDLDV